ncbi:MAG: O-fucosyltransferase family protein [Bacteroidota bacterium]
MRYKRATAWVFTMFSILVLILFSVNRSGPTVETPTLILRNWHPDGGFHFNISLINHALYACEKSNHKLVVLLDSGLYKEDRSHFIADNPYYNKYDWFSYYFEPINQTDQPLSFWKKCVNRSPSIKSITPSELKQPMLDTPSYKYATLKAFTYASIENFYTLENDKDHYHRTFHRIWHQYFKLRPHIQQMVDDFKRKHDFANKYVITLHYRGTDKYNNKHGYEDDAEHPPYEFCSALVKKVIKNSGYALSDIITFIATDEQPFIAHMQQANINAVFTEAIRSSVSTSGLEIEGYTKDSSVDSKRYNALIAQSVHRGMQEKSNYIKGRDVLIDAILLGSGNIFIKSRGNVSNQASWIGGSQMESIDLVDAFNAYKKESLSGNDWRTIYDDL